MHELADEMYSEDGRGGPEVDHRQLYLTVQ